MIDGERDRNVLSQQTATTTTTNVAITIIVSIGNHANVYCVFVLSIRFVCESACVCVCECVNAKQTRMFNGSFQYFSDEMVTSKTRTY